MIGKIAMGRATVVCTVGVCFILIVLWQSNAPLGKIQSTPTAPAPTELLLLDWSWYYGIGHAIVKGRVVNISDRPLNYVEVLVTFKTDDGEFITSNTGPIEFRTLMPDEVSPFTVYTLRNPLKREAHITSFKTLFGDPIRWEKATDVPTGITLRDPPVYFPALDELVFNRWWFDPASEGALREPVIYEPVIYEPVFFLYDELWPRLRATGSPRRRRSQ